MTMWKDSEKHDKKCCEAQWFVDDFFFKAFCSKHIFLLLGSAPSHAGDSENFAFWHLSHLHNFGVSQTPSEWTQVEQVEPQRRPATASNNKILLKIITNLATARQCWEMRMCRWDVIWHNLYKCGRKRSKVHLSRLSPFHFRWHFGIFVGSQIVPNLENFLTILLPACFHVGNHRIPPDSQLRCHFLHFLPSLGRLRSFGNFGCQHFLKSKHSKQKSLPYHDVFLFPFYFFSKRKMIPPKQKYGDIT